MESTRVKASPRVIILLSLSRWAIRWLSSRPARRIFHNDLTWPEPACLRWLVDQCVTGVDSRGSIDPLITTTVCQSQTSGIRAHKEANQQCEKGTSGQAQQQPEAYPTAAARVVPNYCFVLPR